MQSLKNKESVTFAGLISPTSPFEFLGYLIVTLVLSRLPNFVEGSRALNVVDWFSVLSIVGLFLIWWGRERRQKKRLALWLNFQVKKEEPAKARGLILLMSPYDPRRADLSGAKNQGKLQPVLNRVFSTSLDNLSEQDFVNINLLDSNLRPQIRAIEYHLQDDTLRELWLIKTKTIGSVKGSEDAAIILEKYLNFKYPNKLTIHRGEDLAVNEWDYKALADLGNKIFHESDYKEQYLLADITGGTKMMSVALAIACIPPGRRMQYVSSDRDWQGNPLSSGSISPVLIDVDPILHVQA